MSQQQNKLVVFLLAGVALLVLPFIAQLFGNAWVRILDIALLYVLLALGLNIVVGYAGLLDLGYVAFYAVGAYTKGLLASGHLTDAFPAIAAAFPEGLHMPMLIVIPLAALLAGIAGVVLGAPTLRLRGDYLAIATLGAGEIIRIAILNIDAVGGARGFSLASPAHPGVDLRFESLAGVYGTMALAVAAIGRLAYSGGGLAFRAVREDAGHVAPEQRIEQARHSDQRQQRAHRPARGLHHHHDREHAHHVVLRDRGADPLDEDVVEEDEEVERNRRSGERERPVDPRGPVAAAPELPKRQRDECNGPDHGEKGPAVRELAARGGPLYVQSGPIYGANQTLVIGPGETQVPVALYRVLLRRDAAGRWQALGFAVLNDGNAGDFVPETLAVSISDLEARTGLTFFPDLAADEARRLKANVDLEVFSE